MNSVYIRGKCDIGRIHPEVDITIKQPKMYMESKSSKHIQEYETLQTKTNTI